MTKDDAFNTIVAEFAKDMGIGAVSTAYRFEAIAPNGASYLVHVGFKGKDHRTGNPVHLRIVVHQGPHTLHNGLWTQLKHADSAAKIAISTLRNTGYVVQGELL